MQGWIKIHRAMQKWGWRKCPYHTSVFLDILLEANHEDGEYKGTFIPKGSLTTSIEAISRRTGVTHKRIRTILNHLKQTNEVAIKTTPHFTMITVVKWLDYQLLDKDIGKQGASEGQTPGKHRATNKNAKNVKNGISGADLKIVESPFKFLFPENDSIQDWLLTGAEAIQKELLATYDEDYLREKIRDCYFYHLENRSAKKPYHCGTFIKNSIKGDRKPPVLKGKLTKFDIELEKFIDENEGIAL